MGGEFIPYERSPEYGSRRSEVEPDSLCDKIIALLDDPKARKLKARLNEVFGNNRKMLCGWLSQRKIALNGASPASLIMEGRFKEVLKALDKYR